jgi:hypothetical protein
LIPKSAVAESTCRGIGIGEHLKTDRRTGADLLKARRTASKSLERLVTHSGVGTGDGIALKRLPADSHVRTDIESLDIFQGSASGVTQKRI